MFSIFIKNHAIMETLRDYIDRKLSPLGTPEYAYTVVNKKKPSDALIISNYPDKWFKLYRANNFQLTDPVILTAFKRVSPFVWDEDITLMFAKIFLLSKKYNVVNGCTFVLHDQMNNLALLSILIGNKEDNNLEARLSSERGAMQMLLIDINEQMYRLADSVLPGRQQNKATAGKPIFTPRESDVLYWASMGKTYSEVAAILGISVSTVKHYMGSVVIKLGVSNARQAIRLGVELELITSASTAAW
ncbi:LuxR family transcriptional regulator [Gibbsiella greigii]